MHLFNTQQHLRFRGRQEKEKIKRKPPKICTLPAEHWHFSFCYVPRVPNSGWHNIALEYEFSEGRNHIIYASLEPQVPSTISFTEWVNEWNIRAEKNIFSLTWNSSHGGLGTKLCPGGTILCFLQTDLWAPTEPQFLPLQNRNADTSLNLWVDELRCVWGYR